MSRAKGDKAETKAVAFLVQNGFVVIERNFYSRFGELDIVATKDGVLHFVEVKSALEFENAINNITHAKLQKLLKTAQVYMQKCGYDGEFTFDALILTPKEIELIEDITL